MTMLAREIFEDSEVYRGVVEPGSRPSWGQSIVLSKPVKAYHATHEGTGLVLTNREIKSYNSMGTWLTSDKAMATELFADHAEAYMVPAGRYLLAKRGQEMWDILLNCLPIIEKHVGHDAAEHLARFPLNAENIRFMQDTRKMARAEQAKHGDDGGHMGIEELIQNTFRWSDANRLKKYKLLNKSYEYYTKVCKSAEYCKDYREFLEGVGYKGIIWNKRFWDGSSQRHTVFLVFHQEDLHPIKDDNA